MLGAASHIKNTHTTTVTQIIIITISFRIKSLKTITHRVLTRIMGQLL